MEERMAQYSTRRFHSHSSQCGVGIGENNFRTYVPSSEAPVIDETQHHVVLFGEKAKMSVLGQIIDGSPLKLARHAEMKENRRGSARLDILQEDFHL